MTKKPTVITPGGLSAVPSTSSPQLTKPTVIGGEVQSKLEAPVIIKPTAIPVEKVVEVKKTVSVTALSLPPTINASPTHSESCHVSVLPDSLRVQATSKSTVTLEKASVIPGGVARKGIEVTVEMLEKHFPGTKAEVLAEAKSKICCIVIDTLTDVKSSQWGVKSQEKYGQLVSEALDLSSSSQLQTGSKHICRMYELLREMSEAFKEKDVGLAFWKKRETPLEVYHRILPEIKQLSGALKQLLPKVVEIQSNLDSMAREFNLLLVELDAESVSARYLSDLLSAIPSQQIASQRLLDRSLSLSQAMVNIQQGMLMRQTTIQEISKLVSRIQDSVLVTLPAWMEQMSIAQTKSVLTQTELYTFEQSLNEVVQNLTP